MSQMLNSATGERIAGPETRPGVNAELLDVGMVAALLNCSQRHVYRLSDAKRMPGPFKLGALVRWSRSAVSAWITAGCPPIA